jgi:hypothetical protein
VAMRLHAVVNLAGLLSGVDMYNCAGKEFQMMPKLVLHLFSELMPAPFFLRSLIRTSKNR